MDLVLHFNTNTTIWISPCRWKELADGLGGKLAFSPLRNRRSRFASERGKRESGTRPSPHSARARRSNHIGCLDACDGLNGHLHRRTSRQLLLLRLPNT